MTNKFVKKILIFLVPIAVSLLLVEYFVRDIPNDYILKREYLDKNATDVETIILGSSHTYVSLNPELFSSKTFNAAKELQDIQYDHEIFNKYKEEFKNNLKTIIIPISYPSLWSNLSEQKSSEFDLKNNSYRMFYGFKKNTFSLYDYSYILSFDCRELSSELFSYYILGSTNMVHCNTLGWKKRPKTELDTNYLKNTALKQNKFHTVKDLNDEAAKRNFEQNNKCLQHIIKWGKNNNVNIVLLTTPKYKFYRALANKEQYKIMHNTIDNFAKQNTNCYYLNLAASEDFEDGDFADSGHLNELGAIKLSNKVNDFIETEIKP
ncbi:hypothetical protein [Neptunitalea lumnitzerae]|uniref:SGNH/GDSL hydrolase family protein n=1 Tax=Neptunitalea lumnitzerae TaxID=2965509 RepID=A0ABQ5MEX9_9FLAO|nr:hypothetical protein [Neptunitalea sp. Y10]GLB47933.1 hypothetical protein Y10_03010 [Neptunitalea sp. Y10]